MKIFENVAGLAAAHLKDGQIVETKGYTSPGDGGQARYLIQTAVQYTGTPDEFGDHTLANGNVAVLQHTGSVNVLQFGVVGDGATDDITALQKCCDYAATAVAVVIVDSVNILLGGSLVLKSNTHIFGRRASLIKGFVSVGVNANAMIKNENYNVDPVHDSNITLWGVDLASASSANNGTFVSFNWVENFTLKNITAVKDTEGSIFHLNGKTVLISDIRMDSTAAPQFCDGIHFEYAEDVSISDVVATTEDDAIAFAPFPTSWGITGPAYPSKNITVSNCTLSSEIANGLRITCGFIGDVASSNTVHTECRYEHVVFSNITITKVGASGRAIDLYDERENADAPSDDITFNNITVSDPTSAAGILRIQGNRDYTDVTYAATKNFNRVRFTGCTFTEASAGFNIIGAASTVAFSGGEWNTTGTPQQLLDSRFVDNLLFDNFDIRSSATVRVLLLRNIENFRYINGAIVSNAVVNSAITWEQPNTTTSTLLISGTRLKNFTNAANSLSAITAAVAHFVSVTYDTVTNRTYGNITAASAINYSAEQAAFSDGTVGGTGSAGAGNQYVELVVQGVTYKILHDGTV